MKKLTAAIVLCIMLLTLSGCGYIDDLRQKHAALSDDGEQLTLNGNVYKKLPVDDEEVAKLYESNAVYITKPDVPLLFAADLCDYYGYVSTDKKVIHVDDDQMLFVREDVYDITVDAMTSDISFNYTVSYVDADYGTRYHYFTLHECIMLEGIVSAEPYKTVTPDEYQSSGQTVVIDLFNEMGMGEYTESGYRISKRDGSYFVEQKTDDAVYIYASTPQLDETFSNFFPEE